MAAGLGTLVLGTLYATKVVFSFLGGDPEAPRLDLARFSIPPNRHRKINVFSNPQKSTKVSLSIEPLAPKDRFFIKKYPPHPAGCRAFSDLSNSNPIPPVPEGLVPSLPPRRLQKRTLEDRRALGPSKNVLWEGVRKKHEKLMKIRCENERFLMARNHVWRYTLRLFHTFAIFEKSRKNPCQKGVQRSCMLVQKLDLGVTRSIDSAILVDFG